MTAIGNVKFDFAGRVVLVSGGGSGIGREVAAAFADAGATVVIAGRSQPKLDGALEAMPKNVSAIRADVSDRAAVEALVSAVIAEHGQLDIVISNAASYVPGDITDVEPADWETLRSANIDGFFHLALAQFEARVPLGGLAETTDIAPVFLFLASDAARYITGVVLPVDGGTTASNGQARPPSAG